MSEFMSEPDKMNKNEKISKNIQDLRAQQETKNKSRISKLDSIIKNLQEINAIL